MSESYPDPHHETYDKTVFGFWLYLLSDFMMFGVLFAMYIVLQKSTFGGPGPKELFQLSYTHLQTMALLAAAFTSGVGGAFAHKKNKRGVMIFFGLTFLFGALFLELEFEELGEFILMGNTWEKSAFLSAFFTLVGTHVLHMFFAMFWILLLLNSVWFRGVDERNVRRLTCLRMFWQFLSVVWVFIFAIVYLLGVK